MIKLRVIISTSSNLYYFSHIKIPSKYPLFGNLERDFCILRVNFLRFARQATVIYAPAGSYSIKYAKKNKIKYIVGDDTQNIIAPVKSSASEESKTVETKSLDGLKFVVTGDLEKFTDRDELKAFIEARGGKLIGSVSSKTNYLITNEPDSGTTKIQKALELGVQIISEAEFLKMTE